MVSRIATKKITKSIVSTRRTMRIKKHYKSLKAIYKNTKLVHTYFPRKYSFSP